MLLFLFRHMHDIAKSPHRTGHDRDLLHGLGIFLESRLGRSWVYLTPAEVSIRLEARVAMESEYLSDRYSTSFTPLWMMALAHSLQGNRATNRRLFCRLRPLAFKMALSSAWTT